MFTYIIDLTYYYHYHYYYCYYYYYHYFWRWYRLIWARTCITYSLIWFFFLRFCQHEIKHSNPIQSNIQHSMSMVLNRRFHIWFYIITVYYKMRQTLLQNVTAILLQNATEVYYKIRQFFTTKCDSFMTKYDSYYKMWRLLQIAKV